MDKFMVSLMTFWNDITGKKEKGAVATEYALLIFLIAVAIIGAVTLLGGQINTIFTNITTALGG